MYSKKQKEKNKNVQKAGVNFLKNLQWRVLIIGSFEEPTKYLETYKNRQRFKSSTARRKLYSKCLLGQDRNGSMLVPKIKTGHKFSTSVWKPQDSFPQQILMFHITTFWTKSFSLLHFFLSNKTIQYSDILDEKWTNLHWVKKENQSVLILSMDIMLLFYSEISDHSYRILSWHKHVYIFKIELEIYISPRIKTPK